MSQSLNRRPRELREVFYALSIAREVPDATLLDEFVRRYPQFGEELTDFAIAVAIDALRGDRAVEAAEASLIPRSVSPAVSRAMSHFQNRLHAVTVHTPPASGEPDARRMTAGDEPNPFLGLSRAEFRALATQLNANTVFVSKLRDRQIDPATMPQAFRMRVAQELNVPLEVMVAHFEAAPVIPSGQFFKSDSKPHSVIQQSFEEAVRSSGLDESAQTWLMGL